MTGATPRPLVAGNWKMNGHRSSIAILREVIEGYTPQLRATVDLLVCPPATLLSAFAEAAQGSGVAIGGQDTHPRSSGAHTGDISAAMLADAGASHVIVGHSERRTAHRETDPAVRAKAEAVLAAGLVAIVCVGETCEERESGAAVPVVTGQVRDSLPPGAAAATVVIAYEPVWAIGTGLVPTTSDVAAMHAAIRGELVTSLGRDEASLTRILYGGSVKPANARELLAVAEVDGALVGGASLVSTDFLGIAQAYLPL